MTVAAMAAVLLWWAGMVPSGIVGWRRREAEGWVHVAFCALCWPLLVAVRLGTGIDPWRGYEDADQEEAL